MKVTLLTELIVQAEEAIKPIQHSSSTVYQYGLAWNELVLFFELHNCSYFSGDLAHQFVQESKEDYDKGLIKEWRYKLRRRSVHILLEVYETGNYSWKVQSRDADGALSNEMKQLCIDYSNSLIQFGKGKGTRRLYQTIARQFLYYVQKELNKDILGLTFNDVRTFIPFISNNYQATSMRSVLSGLRSFLRFLYKAELSKKELVLAVPSSGSRKKTVVPTITEHEEHQLLQSINRSTFLGKRNYAMILIALRTGLRSSDIISLRLSNIEWRNKTISIVQQKNRKPLILPLLPDVGNALSDYLLNARPESGLPYVFLRFQSPHTKLSRSACYSISRSVMKKASLRQSDDQRKGFHIFRHSLAAKMLSQHIPLPVISNSLGHESISSSKVYLSTDKKHLKACALSFKGIEVTQGELL